MITKDAIIGKFTAQGIRQLVDSGQRIIKLEYEFGKVPSNVFDTSLQFTQGPRIAWDNHEEVDECQLLDELHNAVERDLKEWISEDVRVHGGVVEEFDLEEGQIGFYLERKQIDF